MGSAAEDEAEEFLLPPSAIEAVAELGEAAGQMFPAHTVERASQPGLEVAEDLVAPRKDLARARGIGASDESLVAHPSDPKRR